MSLQVHNIIILYVLLNLGPILIGKLLWEPIYMTYDSPLWARAFEGDN